MIALLRQLTYALAITPGPLNSRYENENNKHFNSIDHNNCFRMRPSKEYYFDKGDLIPEINSSIIYTWEGKIPVTVKYYVVEPYQIEMSRYPIQYVGSTDEFHLFSMIAKGPVAIDELENFAVLKDRCEIEKPNSPEAVRENKTIDTMWIKVENGKVVPY